MELAHDSSTGLLAVFVAVFVATYLWKRRRNSVGRPQPPSLPWLPIVGSLPFLPTSMETLTKMFTGEHNKHGNVVSIYVGRNQVVIISGKQAIHEALVARAVAFANRPKTYLGSFLNPNSKGIVFHLYNQDFKKYQQLCLSILRQFGFGQRVMETRILMEAEDMIERVRARDGQPFNVKELTTACVANVMMNILFGRRFDHADSTFQQLITDMNRITEEMSFALDVFPMLRFIPYFRRKIEKITDLIIKVNGVTDNLIAAANDDREDAESFVSSYTDTEGTKLDREQLRHSVRDLIAAGMETTATTLRWAIVLLTNHVEVQDRLRAEIDNVVGKDRLPSLDDRSRLPYVEATILELMRYKTLVPLAIPHNTLDDTEVCGYFVPRGTMVLVNLYSVHMDPELWDHPQLFRPDRFLDASGSVVGKDNVIPFSLGKRSCLGEQLARQEIFLFLVALLQNFDFKPPEGQDRIEVQEHWVATTEPSPYVVRLVSRV